MECEKCKSTIRGETGKRCDGVCGKIFQLKTNCSGLDDYASTVLNQNRMLRFICDDCTTYIYNMDAAMKDMQMVINKNSALLEEYKGEFEMALKQNEWEIRKLLEAIESKFSQRIVENQKVQKECEVNISEVQRIRDVAETFKKDSEKLCAKLKIAVKKIKNAKRNKRTSE